MSSEAIALGDLCKVKQGRYLSPKDMSDAPTSAQPVPVIGGNGVLGYTSEPSHTTDVALITCRGSKCGLIQWAKAPVWVSNNAIACDTGHLLKNQFLRYLFSAISFEDVITGSAQPQITIGHLSKKVFDVCPEEYWADIVSVLGALDDRITLLRETNATLEGIAQALFKSWFVDFDPVRAKMEGRVPEDMDEATAALFPNSFEDSVLGAVPRGWAVGRLDDFLVLQRGFDLPAQDRKPGQYSIIAASGPSGTHNEAMAKGPGVVTGRSGVLGRIFLTFDDFWPLNTTLWIKDFRAVTACYAYELLRLVDFKSFNAGSAVPTLNRNHIHGLPYVIPAWSCVEAFEAIAKSLHERVKENELQAQALADLRDTLLPRLITGQLRVPDIANEVIQ